jgi:hypothetical protein
MSRLEGGCRLAGGGAERIASLALIAALALAACAGASSSGATPTTSSAATSSPPTAVPTEQPTASAAESPAGSPTPALTLTPTPALTPTPKKTPTPQPGHFAAVTLPKDGGYDAAALLPNGKVLFVGAGKPELYDPATNAFSPAGPMVQERAYPQLAVLPNGKALVIGGNTFGCCAVQSIDSIEQYDPATNRFTLLVSEMPSGDYHTATPLSDGTVLLSGGAAYVDSTWVRVSTLFDPATATFTPVDGSLQPGGATPVALPDHSVLFVGGFSSEDQLVFRPISTAMRYVPAIRQYVAVSGTTVEPRGWSSATLLKDGRVLVAGGVVYSTDAVCPGQCLTSSEIYDPATQQFTASGSMSHGRANLTATLLPSGDVLITGGTYGTVAEIWSGGTFHVTAGEMTHPRAETVAVLLPNGRVLVVGSGSADLYQP